MKQWILAALLAGGVAAATPALALTKADQVGESGRPQAANRTLHVAAGTRYFNVHFGETVKFDIDGRQVAWKFNGLAWVVNLQDIAPGAPDVKVYVSQPNDN